MPLPFSLSNALVDNCPIGSVLPYIGTALPPLFLWCDGSTFTTSSYPLLYNALGTNTVPDMRGRTIFGKYTGQPAFSTNQQLGGNNTITLSANNLPAHTHTGTTSSDGAHWHGGVGGGGNHSHWTNDQGWHNHGYDRSDWGDQPGSPGGNRRITQRNHNGAWTGDNNHGHGIYGSGNHTHNLNTIVDHQHSIGVNNNSTNNDPISIIPPHFKINFIIKAKTF